MRRHTSRMSRTRRVNRAIAVLLAALVAGSSSGGQSLAGSLVRDTVHGISLEKNAYGDSPDRAVLVYLPPSYRVDSTRRYPTVYLLHGFGGTEASWIRGYARFNVQQAMDSLIAAGAVREMIIVMPNARNR